MSLARPCSSVLVEIAPVKFLGTKHLARGAGGMSRAGLPGTSFADHLNRGDTILPAAPSKSAPSPHRPVIGESPPPSETNASSTAPGGETGDGEHVRGNASAPRERWEVDPVTRALAHANCMGRPEPLPTSNPVLAERACSAASVERVFAELVRKVAWSGDARRGSVRVEIGTGSLAGAVLLVHADCGEVRVSMQLPSGTDRGAWHERIARRLESRGLQVSSLEVE